MFDLPVFYASTEGQTRRIAEHIADTLRSRGLNAMAIDVAGPAAEAIDWRDVQGAIVGASLHLGHHQLSAVKFVKRHVKALNDRPSMFFSVSMAIRSKNAKGAEQARVIAADFLNDTQWHPDSVVCVAGRLAYTKYGWLTRFAMKRIARKEGGPTDVSRDWEFTDWDAVDRYAIEFAARLRTEPHRVAS